MMRVTGHGWRTIRAEDDVERTWEIRITLEGTRGEHLPGVTDYGDTLTVMADAARTAVQMLIQRGYSRS